MSHLTAEKAITALSDILDTITESETMTKLNEAKANAGNEMLKMMQYSFPLVMQIQMDVIKKYGFSEGREGIVQFAQIIRTLERENSEVARLNSLIRSYYLPPVSVNSSTETPYEVQIET